MASLNWSGQLQVSNHERRALLNAGAGISLPLVSAEAGVPAACACSSARSLTVNEVYNLVSYGEVLSSGVRQMTPDQRGGSANRAIFGATTDFRRCSGNFNLICYLY